MKYENTYKAVRSIAIGWVLPVVLANTANKLVYGKHFKSLSQATIFSIISAKITITIATSLMNDLGIVYKEKINNKAYIKTFFLNQSIASLLGAIAGATISASLTGKKVNYVAAIAVGLTPFVLYPAAIISAALEKKLKNKTT